MLNPELDPNTYSYGLIDLIARFEVGRRGITEGEVQKWVDNLRSCDVDQPYFFSLNRYLFLAIKPP